MEAERVVTMTGVLGQMAKTGEFSCDVVTRAARLEEAICGPTQAAEGVSVAPKPVGLVYEFEDRADFLDRQFRKINELLTRVEHKLGLPPPNAVGGPIPYPKLARG